MEESLTSTGVVGGTWIFYREELKAICGRTLETTQTALLFLSLSMGPDRFASMIGESEVPELKEAVELRSKLKTINEILSRCSQNIVETQTSLSNLSSELLKNWDQVHEDRSTHRIQCSLDKMNVIYKQFKKARMRPGLGYNEEQIHKLDKVNFGHLAKRLLLVFQEDCVQKYQTALLTHGKRMRMVHETRKHLQLVSSSVTACKTEAKEAQGQLSKIQDRLCHRLWQGRMKAAQNSPPPFATYSRSMPKDLVLHIQELREEMKLLAFDLQHNNQIIERLSAVPPAPASLRAESDVVES